MSDGPTVGTHRIRVRYAETDQMGVVYHANHLIWFEEGRTMLMHELGHPYHELERGGIALAVRHAEVRYRDAAYYGDVVRVSTRVDRVRGASVRFAYRIENDDDGGLVATGSTELACLDMADGRKPRLLPDGIREVLERAAGQAPRGGSSS